MRRALHNQIQELRGNVRVFCRVRPSTSALQCAELGQDGSSVTVLRDPEDPATAAAFDFDRAFGPTSSQARPARCRECPSWHATRHVIGCH